jgi:hypothetical protein
MKIYIWSGRKGRFTLYHYIKKKTKIGRYKYEVGLTEIENYYGFSL